VEKGIVDLIQFRFLAQRGASRDAGVLRLFNLQVAGAAVAGAMVSAEYLAGGIQALTTLFRSDYSVSVNANSRPNLFEQRSQRPVGTM